MNLPLAIYTAGHGLAWNYEAGSISYAEIDACRTILAPMPDFDSGDSGYEGIAAIQDRVFVIRCFKARKWDFRGRDAVYMAVTWIRRSEADQVNFQAILDCKQMTEPSHDLPHPFEVESSDVDGDGSAIGQKIVHSGSEKMIGFVRRLDGEKDWRVVMTEAEKVLTSQDKTEVEEPGQSPAECAFRVDAKPDEETLSSGDENSPRHTERDDRNGPSKGIRIIWAVLICAALLISYAFVGALLGWRHGGGYIPLAILMGAFCFVWHSLVGRK